MNLLNPLAFAFALLAVPIILLYLLRLQRREQNVSSTMLWQQVTMDREANTLWQKLRRNLLLILQLITLGFLVFALIRPYINVPGSVSGRTILMIDASASMQANDVQPSRFEAARTQARNLINGLGNNDQMTLIVVDGAPRALSTLTSDKSQLLDALASVQPTLDAANWSAAIALASATGANNAETTTLIISDGANADELALLPGRARFIPIGNSGDNVAISTLSVRRTVRGVAAFARVTNTGAQDDTVLVSLRADGSLVDARTISVPAGRSVEWTVNTLNTNVANVQASIDEATRNYLRLDDAAFTVNASNVTRQALLLTRGNRFLEQALSTLPNLRVTRAVTAPVGAQTYDLYVLDGLTMTLPSQANVLLIGAQTVFSTTGTFSNTAFVRAETHPVLRQVDWRPVNVLDARTVLAPDWLRPLVESQGGPLLYAGEPPATSTDTSVRRMVVLPFDIRRSDLPLQIAFPVLIANSVDWLAPPQGVNVPTSVRPGDVIGLPQNTTVTLPDGTALVTDRRGFVTTQQTGLYQFRLPGTSNTNGAFAVNFSHATESRIAPNPDLQIGANGVAQPTTQNQSTSQREFWHMLALGALLLLIAEWWIYQRGVPVLIRR